MSQTFSHDEVFPLIASVIMRAKVDHVGFVDHDAIVSALLADGQANALINRASMESSLPDRRGIAANMVAFFSKQITEGKSGWAEFFERERRNGTWAYCPKTTVRGPMGDDVDLAAVEGEPRLFFHLRRERKPELIKAKREAVLAAQGRLECEVCGFVTRVIFPDLDADVCEIHHRSPLGAVTEAVETRLEDLAVLCPNCHRAIHRTKPLLSVEEFRDFYFPSALR